MKNHSLTVSGRAVKSGVAVMLAVLFTGCRDVGGGTRDQTSPPALPAAEWVVYAYNKDVGGYEYSVWCTHHGNEDVAAMRLVPVNKKTYDKIKAAPVTENVNCPG